MSADPNSSAGQEAQGEAEKLAEGRTWGSFKLLAMVGRGSFGEVYRAWDPHLEREVGLKILLPRSAGDEEQFKALLREARALAAVRHPNIVPVHGIDEHDGLVGFWTDFVHGKTLASLVREQGPFGYREAVLIGIDVCKALSAVHRAGLLHRDIKAENVMREEGGRILLMDFGLSTLPHLQEGFAGTPVYMAPELFAGAASTVESDIYAALCAGGIHVMDVRCPAHGLSNIAYARIKPQGGGDAKQALGIMLTCSKQALPKIAMVFDADVDIWSDERIAQCMAFRYMPDRDTIIIPQCNAMSVDPKVGDPDKPFVCSKIGLDCTIPLVGDVDRSAYDWSSACDLGPAPKNVVALDKEALTKDMEAFIRAAPRSWKDILQRYHGQPYRPIYQAFSALRHRLGRCSDAPWYRYAFLDSGLADATPGLARLSNHDPRHQPAPFAPPQRADAGG